PGAPCFADNLDILGGQKQHNLLRTDDLVLLKIAPQESPPGPVFDEWQLNSANSTLSTTGTFLSVTVPTNGTPMTRVVTGRMFNVGKDTTIAPVAGNSPFIYLHIAGVGTNEQFQATLANGSINRMSTADFTGDGFAEFVVNFGTGSMQIATAADVNTPFNLKWGPVANLDPLMQMTVGDFDGDGQPEIAGLSGCVSLAAGCNLNIYSVDPTTLTITRAASQPLSTLPGWLTAGRFGTPNYDQLATLTLGSGGKGFTVQAYDFATGSFQPIAKGVATASFA